MKRIFLFLTIICCIPSIWGQDLAISGTVLDASFNEPLPGVSIIVKNTVKGTTTDFDGNFTMTEMTVGDILVFSYLGFVTQEFTVSNSRSDNNKSSGRCKCLGRSCCSGLWYTKEEQCSWFCN